MPSHELYMQRCLELARKGAGFVAPNPMVGAVLVAGERIIGEGWHQKFGEAHAEVNCINEARQTGLAHLFPSSTLYVSLEPCSHFGKTPPCCDLIIKEQIGKVVIGCRDPFPLVNGKGIERLQEAGIEVVAGILQQDCETINKRFFTFHQQQRPYVILKWAQTNNGIIGNSNGERLFISNEYSNRLVHQWRSEEAAILVGTNTAFLDNPQLNNRYWNGPQPLRLLLDKTLKIPTTHHLLSDGQPVLILNQLKEVTNGNQEFIQLDFENNMVQQILDTCFQRNLQSLLVEGGARLLQAFIDTGIWDEVRIITNHSLRGSVGVAAPELKNALLFQQEQLLTDSIDFYSNQHKQFKPV